MQKQYLFNTVFAGLYGYVAAKYILQLTGCPTKCPPR